MDTEKEYILSEGNQERYAEMLRITKLPLAAQRFMHYTTKISYPTQYHAKVLYKKEDKITMVEKSFRLMWTTKGYFIKQNSNCFGLTYTFKGSSSSRLKLWGQNTYGNSLPFDLMKQLLFHVRPGLDYLIDNRVLRELGTLGMWSTIFSGKIENIEQAMVYLIKYSFRGLNINHSLANNLYYMSDVLIFKSPTISKYKLKQILQTSVSTNQLLLQFQEPMTISEDLVKQIGQNQRLVHLSMMLDQKIDWTDTRENLTLTIEKLTKKASSVKDILNLWEGDSGFRYNNKSKGPVRLNKLLNSDNTKVVIYSGPLISGSTDVW